MNRNCKAISNKEINAPETKERKGILESMPRKLMVILTRTCNLRCIMCPRSRDKPLTLPFHLVERTFELFPFLEKVAWQGGEVFLLDYFKRLFLKTASYPNILQHITTNGLLVDKDWAKLFSQSNVTLLYSIDAVTKETYESIRLNARFEDLLRSLDLVNDANARYNDQIKLDLIAVVMKCNYKELHLLPEFCKRYNFRGLLLDVLWPDTAPEEDIFGTPHKPALQYLNQVIPRIEEKCKEYNLYFNCTFEPYLRDFACDGGNGDKKEDDFSIPDEGSAQPKWDCLFPWNNLHVEPDGHVYPECKCTRSIGDLTKDSFAEIWNGEIMQLYRSLIRNGEADKICSEQCRLYAALKRRETK